MKFIRRIIFHLLLGIRGLVLGISKIFAICCIVFTIALFTMSAFKQTPLTGKIMTLGFGILFTAINWFYDDLIFYFAPEDREITLFR